MKVLFLCSGNAFRSPVAEALLKMQNPEIEVDSAGTNPIVPDGIAGSAIRFLAKVGAEQYLKRFPEGIDGKQLEKYDLIVAMKARHRDAVLDKCPECADKIVVWNVEDPYFLPRGRAEDIFNQIREKVVRLANQL
jgi:protein-tyrosine-phosphatase